MRLPVACRRVMGHIRKILDASPMKPSNMRILLTGHSLGGAVAMLAAHDLNTELGFENIQVRALKPARMAQISQHSLADDIYSAVFFSLLVREQLWVRSL